MKRTNKNMWWAAATLGLALAPATAAAQDNDCAATDVCLEACEGPTDTECVNACIGQAAPEVAAVYQSVFTCLTASGCDPEDDECFFEACGEELEALFAACGEVEDDCAENPGPDCCGFANDGACDEPDLCAEGTDTTDCTNFPGCDEQPGPDCCNFANDGECDEPDFCDPGTDTTDCGGGNPEPEGNPEGEPEGEPEGNPEGEPDGTPEGEPDVGDTAEPEAGGGTPSTCSTSQGRASSGGLLLLLGLALLAWRRQR